MMLSWIGPGDYLKKAFLAANNRCMLWIMRTASWTDRLPTRQSLLERLKQWSDQGAWQEFFDTYWRFIYGCARRAGLGDAEAQDVVQDTVLSVAKQMPGFTYNRQQGSFKAWLRLITRRRVADQLRKKYCRAGEPSAPREVRLGTTTAEALPDDSASPLEQHWEEEWQRNLQEVALERIKHRVNARHYQMFYLRVVRQMPVREVARHLEVKGAEVYYATYKVAALLKREVWRLERKGL
jgi:RNA polymerase sigma-70 factor (ECF subfamily)